MSGLMLWGPGDRERGGLGTGNRDSTGVMMSIFTDAEVEYLNSQPLGRFATVDPDGRPHVMPVGVFYDPETQTIVIGGAGDMAASKKFRDAQRRPDVAVVVDDTAAHTTGPRELWREPGAVEPRAPRPAPREARGSSPLIGVTCRRILRPAVAVAGVPRIRRCCLGRPPRQRTQPARPPSGTTGSPLDDIQRAARSPDRRSGGQPGCRCTVRTGHRRSRHSSAAMGWRRRPRQSRP